MHERESCKPVIDGCDLQALGLHCIKNWPHSVMEISAWTQEHLQKSLTVNTVHCAIHKCPPCDVVNTA